MRKLINKLIEDCFELIEAQRGLIKKQQDRIDYLTNENLFIRQNKLTPKEKGELEYNIKQFVLNEINTKIDYEYFKGRLLFVVSCGGNLENREALEKVAEYLTDSFNKFIEEFKR